LKKTFGGVKIGRSLVLFFDLEKTFGVGVA